MLHIDSIVCGLGMDLELRSTPPFTSPISILPSPLVAMLIALAIIHLAIMM